MSAFDSPETDDFIPKKKPVLETKRPARRGKKATTEELESNDESETTNVEVEKQLTPRAKRSVSTKSARKARGKKNQDFPEVDNDENVTESVAKQGEMIDSNKDGQTLGNQKDSMVKSTKKGRSKKSQGVTEVDSNENIPEDVAKQDAMVEKKKGKNTQGQQKDSVEKPTESVEQELPDAAMTPVVNTRISRGGRKGKQTSTKKSRNGASGNAVQNVEQVQDKNEMDEPANNVDETKMKEPKTPARGRARKRKSSENSNETTQQKKGTAKKSRKNTTTEENSETKDETHHGRETTASPQDDIKVTIFYSFNDYVVHICG